MVISNNIKGTNIFFSVVMPLYNTKDYLTRSVNSVLNQTFSNFELIIVDDGSIDGSSELSDDLAQNDSRIKVIHQCNMGAVKARKVGVNIATGNYIVFIDSDDWIENNAFEEYVRLISEYEPDIIEFGFTKEYDGMPTRRSVQLKPGYYSKQEFEESYRSIFDSSWPFVYAFNDVLWSKVIKKELIIKCMENVDDNITMGGDTAVSVQLQVFLDSIYISEKAFYHFSVREGSITYSRLTEKYDSYIELNRHFAKVMKSPICKPIYKKNMIIRSYELLLDYLSVVPEDYFSRFAVLPFFKNVNREDRVVVYGKGKYANNFIKIINKFKYANIVANVDSLDYKGVFNSLSSDEYDCVIMAIGDYNTSKSIAKGLSEIGVKYDKIRFFDYEFMQIANLPEDIRLIYE